MSYISEIFDRANIQNITEYLLWYDGVTKDSKKSYEQRLEEKKNTAFDMIDSKFSGMIENDKITGKIYNYANEVKDVYMEIGMQCGAFIVFQLLRNFNDSKD